MLFFYRLNIGCADATTAQKHYEDHTPEEDTYAFKSVFHALVLKRDRGTRRPTKKDRREIDDPQDDWQESKPEE